MSDEQYRLLAIDGSAVTKRDGPLEQDDAAIRTEIEELERDIRSHEGTEKDYQTELDRLLEYYNDRKERIRYEIVESEAARQTCESLLDKIVNPPTDEPKPQGPRCLAPITSGYFDLLATFVIVTNIATMVLEMLDESKVQEFFWLDQSFMVFYVLEIFIKATYLRRLMVCGPLAKVWWNYLDIFIVATGVLDMWMMPLLTASGLLRGGGHSLKMFSFLRMLRLLRILKIIGLFLKADLSFAEKPPFQLFIMGVIGFNSIIMSFESDMPDFFIWFYVEQLLLIIFSCEVLIRLRLHGLRFFYHKTDIVWNLLDFTIVTGGVFDQWLMPCISLVKIMMGLPPSSGGSMGQVMTMLRMARLLRILRLVRLIKSIPPLYTLVVGILQAIQGMMWVMVLTVLVLYVCSLLGVKLVGQGLLFGGAANTPLAVRRCFDSMGTSAFNMFKAMNGDWESFIPLMSFYPMSKVAFVLYMIMTNWAILSILTAVVSENMLQATAKHREEEDEEGQKRKEIRSASKLHELFLYVDKDRSGKLTKNEFDMLLSDPAYLIEFKDATDLELETLSELFEHLCDHPEQGAAEQEPTIRQTTFIQGLKDEASIVRERSVMRLEKRIQMMESVSRAIERQTPAARDGRQKAS